MHVCVSMYMLISVCVHFSVFVMCVFMSLSVSVYLYICMCLWVSVCVSVRVSMYVCAALYMYKVRGQPAESSSLLLPRGFQGSNSGRWPRDSFTSVATLLSLLLKDTY